jgi:hypothetical protein
MRPLRYLAYDHADHSPHVVVDGSARTGTLLTLSHWPGSATPQPLRADLSAEIAFRYLEAPELHVDAGAVTNNHFDQDGLTAAYALVSPDDAAQRRNTLIDVARAGDFGKFRDRNSAPIAMAIAELGDSLDADDPYP